MNRADGRLTSIYGLETLEFRRLLTTAAVDAAHVLNIVGTGKDDTIFVNRVTNGKVTVSGVATQFSPGAGTGQFNKINITAGGGNDRVTISSNVPYTSATISGGTGSDVLVGGKGNDSIIGGDDNDTVDGGGGGGADVLSGSAGFDTTNYSTRTDNLTITLDGKANDGGNGGAEKDKVLTEEVIGGLGNDSMTGSSADDFLCGSAGNDVLKGMGGNDDLIGSTGIDQIFGNEGDDFLQAKNQDRDTVNGGSNADGSNDFDLASVDSIDQPGLSARAAAAAAAPAGDDSTVGIEQFINDVDLNGQTSILPLANRLKNLTIWSKLCVFGQPNSDGVVTLNLAARDDSVVFSNINVNGTPLLSVNVNGVVLTYDPATTTQFVINLDGGNDLLLGNDRVRVPMIVHGGEGNDTIVAGGRNDIIYGDAGDDSLTGGARNDVLIGGDGNDSLFGGDGRDILIGGNQVDHLYGERGEDILIGGSTIYDIAPDSAPLTAIMDEWQSGNSQKDRLAHLRNGGGLNGTSVLSTGPSPTVLPDKGRNLLNGGYGEDWFFKGATDTTKQGVGEVIEKA